MKPLQWRARILLSRRLAVFLALFAAALGAFALVLGWGLDIAVFRRIAPGQAGMAITTAVALLGCAAGVLVDSRRHFRHRGRLRRALGWALLGVAVLDLLLLMREPGRALDHLLFDLAGTLQDLYMSPATAVCLAMAALCLLLPRRRMRRLAGDLFSALVAAGLAVAIFALTGHFFDSQALREVLVFTAMSPQTAGGLFLLFLALAASRPTAGWMALVTGPGPGGDSLRRLLPFAAFGPFLLCWLALLAVEAEFFDANFRLSVLAIANAGALVALLFWSAQRENADWRSLVASNRRLQRALAERDLLLREVYHRVKNNLQFVDAMLALETQPGDQGVEAQRLAQIRRRVHALGLVHQQLIGARDLATLSLRGYLGELCANLARGGGFAARGIGVETDIADVGVDLDQAMPLGLVVTELVSNAAKHAFPDNRAGVISVTAALAENDRLRLVVSDNGVGGTAAESGSAGDQKVGRLILRSLAAQLHAEMIVEDGDGLRVVLELPLKQM